MQIAPTPASPKPANAKSGMDKQWRGPPPSFGEHPDPGMARDQHPAGDAGPCLGHCWNLGIQGRTLAGDDVIAMLNNVTLTFRLTATPPNHAL